jgi:hypothetical protein
MGNADSILCLNLGNSLLESDTTSKKKKKKKKQKKKRENSSRKIKKKVRGLHLFCTENSYIKQLFFHLQVRISEQYKMCCVDENSKLCKLDISELIRPLCNIGNHETQQA